MEVNQNSRADEQNILKTIDNIKNLPTIPHILAEVNKMLQETGVSIEKMGDIIESDHVLTSRILKLANSAFYGFRSKIVDIRQAVMILGFNTVRNALTAVSVIDLFRAKEKYGGFDIRELWEHSAAVAITGKHLAERAHLASPSDCFVAGLLHDIGKLIMAQYFTDIFKQTLELTRKKNISFFDAEREISPIDHALIGGYLARKWQLPDCLVDAITYHHTVDRNGVDYWLQVSVYAANMIVNHNFTGTVYEELLSSCPDLSDVMPRLGTLPELRSDMDAEIEQINNLFSEDDNL
jgi:putative nucleotidyltransferase with HDIG domain